MVVVVVVSVRVVAVVVVVVVGVVVVTQPATFSANVASSAYGFLQSVAPSPTFWISPAVMCLKHAHHSSMEVLPANFSMAVPHSSCFPAIVLKSVPHFATSQASSCKTFEHDDVISRAHGVSVSSNRELQGCRIETIPSLPSRRF